MSIIEKAEAMAKAWLPKQKLLSKKHLPNGWLSHERKETFLLQGFALAKIPLIAFLAPKVLRLDEDVVEIMIPLNYRSKNHLGSMYFGALATGADLALGYMAFREFQKRGLNIQLVFKSLQAEFLKRAEADVTFRFTEGAALHEQIAECLLKSERVTRAYDIFALTPSLSGDEPVAKFRLELSLKNRGQNRDRSRDK